MDVAQFESAVLCQFDPTTPAATKQQAEVYTNQLKASPGALTFLGTHFGATARPEVAFWCLGVLLDAVSGAAAAAVEQPVRDELKVALLSWLRDRCPASALPQFVANKYAGVLTRLALDEYPELWPCLFHDLLSFMQLGPRVASVVLTVLAYVDEEVTAQHVRGGGGAHGVPSASRAAQIKDAMRADCVPQLVASWLEVVDAVAAESGASALAGEWALAQQALHVLAQFTDWVDIALVANPSALQLLHRLLQLPQLREGAVQVLHAVVTKGMEPADKLAFLAQLQILPVLQQLVAQQAIAGALQAPCAWFSTDEGAEITPFLEALASLLTAVAAEYLACCGGGQAEAIQATSECNAMALRFLACEEQGVSSSVVEHARAWLSAASGGGAATSTTEAMGALFEVSSLRLRYPLDHDFECAAEAEENFAEHRRDLEVIVHQSAQRAPEAAATIARAHVASTLGSISASTPWNEVELALTLQYILGEALGNGMTSPVADLVRATLSSPASSYPHKAVSLVFFDLAARYQKILAAPEHSDVLLAVLQAMLDERGIRSPDATVSARAAYLFLRIVKPLRSQIAPHAVTVLQSLSKVMGTADGEGLDWSEREHLYEAAGLLAASHEDAVGMLEAVLVPTRDQIDAYLSQADSGQATPMTATSISYRISALGQVSKAFTSRQMSEHAQGAAIAVAWGSITERVMRAVASYPDRLDVHAKAVFFLHRMVSVLHMQLISAEALPRLLSLLLQPASGAAQNTVSEGCRAFCDVAVLLGNMAAQFQSAASPLLAAILPQILASNELIAGVQAMGATRAASSAAPASPQGSEIAIGGPAEELRERLDVRKATWVLLGNLMSSELDTLLGAAALGSQDTLPAVLGAALATTAEVPPDLEECKIVFRLFLFMVRKWGGGANAAEEEQQRPGFKRWVFDTMTATGLLLVLSPTFSLADAQTTLVTYEIAKVQRAAAMVYGEEYVRYIVGVSLPAVGIPADCAQAVQYAELLAAPDGIGHERAFRSFFRRLMDSRKNTASC